MAGRKLTVPAHDETPPESLPLNYPKGNGWFHRDQVFYGSDANVDLADFARIGSYTMAERWKAVPHSAEQEKLFGLLLKALDDPSERVKLQAAYFLGLLRDPRSEPKIETVRQRATLAKLFPNKTIPVTAAWRLGPADSAVFAKSAPESGPLDLTAAFGSQNWHQAEIGSEIIASSMPRKDAAAKPARTEYLLFSVQSGARQKAFIGFDDGGPSLLWVNGQAVGERIKIDYPRGWIVDLQPGGNEILIKKDATNDYEMVALARSTECRLSVKATAAVQPQLTEKLDSSLLAARLRDAAAAGGAQPITKEFLDVDWTKEAVLGDAAAGRKLFGTLACTKCHAITADQKSAGAPSLVGAKLRFTVPHLVESVLLPSRQVAEPFRAQTFTTTAGQTFTGLVVGETAETVELLLPDATRKTLAVKEIEERAPTTLSPMPQGLVKTPAELRDLLAYLLSEKPTPP